MFRSNQAKPSFDTDWASLHVEHEATESERYLIAREAFLGIYSSRRLARKLLTHLSRTSHLFLALRHGDGRALVLEQIVASTIHDRRKRIKPDLSYDTVEKLLLPLISHGRIPGFAMLAPFWDRIASDDAEMVFADYDWLERSLPQANEWLLRELCFRTDFTLQSDDGFFSLDEICSVEDLRGRVLRNYKRIKENILNKDFGEAQREQHERKQRYAPRTGEGGLYKEVKVRLHPELIDTLKDVVGGGNRTAWIEEAILQRLEREGVEFSLPEQPPLPHK